MRTSLVVRRTALSLSMCALAARLLAACGDGSVRGQGPPPIDDPYYNTSDAPDDHWTELYDDVAYDTQTEVDASVDVVLRDARVDGPAAPDPCAIRDDGTWCAALLGLPSTGLLRCMSRHSMGVTPCPNGCLDRPGATDACLDDSVDPCFDERDGLYCGSAIGSTTHANDAVRCAYHRTSWTGTCLGGCTMTGATVNCTR